MPSYSIENIQWLNILFSTCHNLRQWLSSYFGTLQIPDDFKNWQLRNQLKSGFSISLQVPLYGASHMHALNQLSFVQGYQLCTAIGM